MIAKSSPRNLSLVIVSAVCFSQARYVSASASASANDTDDKNIKKKFRTRGTRPQQFQSIPSPNAIGSAKSLRSSSLSERAFYLSGDTAFARQLAEEEQRQKRMIQQEQTTPSEPSPLIYAGLAVLALFSMRLGGSAFFFKDIIPKAANLLAVAWLPTLIVHASWIETLSFASLLVQPSIRNFFINDFLPDTWATIQKMVLGEIWRRIWAFIFSPLPKPLFTPRKYHLSAMPRRLQKGWQQLCEVIDKFTQTMIRKSVERSFHDSIGVVYESMTNSMMEISILYEEATPSDVQYSKLGETSMDGEKCDFASDNDEDSTGDITI